MALRKPEDTGSCNKKQQIAHSGEPSLEWASPTADYMIIISEQHGNVANSTSRFYSIV